MNNRIPDFNPNKLVDLNAVRVDRGAGAQESAGKGRPTDAQIKSSADIAARDASIASALGQVFANNHDPTLPSVKARDEAIKLAQKSNNAGEGILSSSMQEIANQGLGLTPIQSGRIPLRKADKIIENLIASRTGSPKTVNGIELIKKSSDLNPEGIRNLFKALKNFS